jgi:uncharacterized protein
LGGLPRRFLNLVEAGGLETLAVITADPADNRILECATAARSDYIVAGDDQLLRLQRHNKTRIPKMADFRGVLRGAA